jgi:actin-like ATPase involved in cell morphogenesis
MVNEFSLFQYLMQVAPALGISVWALFKVWGRYTDEQDSRRAADQSNLEYHRENDKENLKLMIEFRDLLNGLLSSSETTKITITKEIQTQAESIKQHVDKVIVEKKVKEYDRG